MIFSLGEAVLLLALVLTSVLVGAMYRELRRQNGYRKEFGRILIETSTALEGIDRAVREFDHRGAVMLKALGTRISQARELMAELDRTVDAGDAASSAETAHTRTRTEADE